LFIAGIWRYSGVPFPIPADYNNLGKAFAWFTYALAVLIPLTTALLFVRDWHRNR
jgi:hypothetical protein